MHRMYRHEKTTSSNIEIQMAVAISRLVLSQIDRIPFASTTTLSINHIRSFREPVVAFVLRVL